MNVQGNGPPKGNDPNIPQRVPPPGSSGPSGPSQPQGPGGMGQGPGPATPSVPGGPGGAEKRFCSSCGMEWPADTKFCTACGEWMEGGPEKKSYKEHIERQILDRQEKQALPSFAEVEPQKKEKKGIGKLKTLLLILLFLVAIGTVGFIFFKGPAYWLIGNGMTKLGKYDQAAAWFNSGMKAVRSGTWFDKSSESMEDAAVKLYGESMEKMRWGKYVADVELKIGPEGSRITMKGKEYKSGVLNRVEFYMTDRSGKEKLAILAVGKEDVSHAYQFLPRRLPEKKTIYSEEELKGMEKSNLDETLEKLKKYAKWHIEEEKEKVNGVECYVVNVRVEQDNLGKFSSDSGFSLGDINNPNAATLNDLIIHIGVEDKLVYRITGLEGSQELSVFNYKKIDFDAKIPGNAFDIPVTLIKND